MTLQEKLKQRKNHLLAPDLNPQPPNAGLLTMVLPYLHSDQSLSPN